jgi:hypothetical protein
MGIDDPVAADRNNKGHRIGPNGRHHTHRKNEIGEMTTDNMDVILHDQLDKSRAHQVSTAEWIAM